MSLILGIIASSKKGFTQTGDIFVAGDTSPYIHAYEFGAGFGTKYADPATLPTGQVNQVAINNANTNVAVAMNTSPGVHVYPWSAGFGTKYANPATLPSGVGRSVVLT